MHHRALESAVGAGALPAQSKTFRVVFTAIKLLCGAAEIATLLRVAGHAPQGQRVRDNSPPPRSCDVLRAGRLVGELKRADTGAGWGLV